MYHLVDTWKGQMTWDTGSRLQSWGTRPLSYDHHYSQRRRGEQAIVTIWVDDLLLFASSKKKDEGMVGITVIDRLIIVGCFLADA